MRLACAISFATTGPVPTSSAAAPSPVCSSSGLAVLVRRFSAATTSTGPAPPRAICSAVISPEVPARCEAVRSCALTLGSRLSASTTMPAFSRSSNGRVVDANESEANGAAVLPDEAVARRLHAPW